MDSRLAGPAATADSRLPAILGELGALRHHGIRFADDLPVLEDWDVLMHVAPLTGVVSINAQTSLYRQLDDGNAFAAETIETGVHDIGCSLARDKTAVVVVPGMGDAVQMD